MGWQLEDFLDPVGKIIDSDNKYVNTFHGLFDPIASGSRRIVEGKKEGGWRGAIGGLSDAAAWGAGDFISPLYTDKEGDNPIYDRVGPIMAGYWGGPIFGGIADKYAQGSKYSEVGDLGLGSLASGFGDSFGGGWAKDIVDIFKGTPTGTESTVAGDASWYDKLANNEMFVNLLRQSGSSIMSGGPAFPQQGGPSQISTDYRQRAKDFLEILRQVDDIMKELEESGLGSL